MRIFKPRYRDKSGQWVESKTYRLEFRDHAGIVRQVSALRDKDQSASIGDNIERLVSHRSSREPLPPELSKWLETLPRKTRDRLGSFGLLDATRAAALDPLSLHLDGDAERPGYRQHLQARGSTAQHVNLVMSRVRRVLNGCGFKFWSDIQPTRVMHYLSGLRADRADDKGRVKRGRSAQTINFYIETFQAFCRWMVRDGRAAESPVESLQTVNIRTDRRHDRRALTLSELQKLLDETADGPVRRGMTGPERVMLYRFAVETGLRANEIRSLTRASFSLDVDRPTVTVAAAYSKRRREDVLPLKHDTADALRDFLRGKLPTAKVFNMPRKPGDTALAIRADLEEAGISYRDDQDRVADFHCLRHTFVTNLVRSGCHPKTAQQLARHSTITLTMDRYTTPMRVEELGEALERLPDLDARPRKTAAATGTDGRAENLPEILSERGDISRTSADFSERIRGRAYGSETPENRDIREISRVEGEATKRTDSVCGHRSVQHRGKTTASDPRAERRSAAIWRMRSTRDWRSSLPLMCRHGVWRDAQASRGNRHQWVPHALKASPPPAGVRLPKVRRGYFGHLA
jgi:integrase